MSDGLTPQQRAAIEALDADVCVSAGAGSGKTRVLVERYLRLVLGEDGPPPQPSPNTGGGSEEGPEALFPSPSIGGGARGGGLCPNPRTPERLNAAPRAAVNEILAMTFTRKAALEMKERIARALVERGRSEERRRLEVGYISTIHTFCERVLRENPFEAGLDPDFTMLDEADAALLLHQAYEQVLEAAFTRADDPVASLAQDCYDSRTPQGADGVAKLGENAMDLLALLASRGWTPAEVAAWAQEPLDEFLNRSLALLAEQLDPVIQAFRGGIAVLETLSLGTKVMEQNRREVVALGAGLRTWEKGVQVFRCSGVQGGTTDDRPPTTDGSAPTAQGSTLNAQGSLPEHLTHIATQLRLLQELHGKLKGQKTKDVDPESYATAREQFEGMKHAYKSIETWAEHWSPERERRAQELARAGLELVARLWERYEALKRERGVLDFNDLQRLTRDLLRDSPTVRARMRGRLKYLMVDEFQDTDRLQCEILDLLHGERNLFFVGDAKQSIYRFRNADVALFRERERRLQEAEAAAAPAGRRLALSVNFRSRPEVLAFVNGLFGRLWADAIGAYESLEAGSPFEARPIPSIDLLPMPNAGGIDAIRREEARRIARRIQELMADGPPITRSDHRRCGERLRAADFVLLLRTTSVAAIYEQALEEAGLATFLVGGRNYYARREIRDVVNLLTTISRPLDDLAVASTLRSPFVGVSLDTLSLLSMQARALPEEPRSLYGAIRPALDAQPIETGDGERLRAFTALIERIRGQEDRFRVGQILEIVLAETEYPIEVLRRRGGRRTFANVRKLQQMANAHSGGVLEFVERIEELRRVREHEGNAPTHAENADVVRLMTIHQAKGLEFPVVVLPDLGRWPPRSERPLLAVDPDARRAACRVWDGGWHDAPLHHTLAAAHIAAEREESLRLLYVALTRAEEHLILAGPHPARTDTWAKQIWDHTSFDGAPANGTISLFDGAVQATVLREC